MTSTTNTARLSYADARRLFGTHPIRISEIPVEHAISLPVPTLRCGAPGYAGFAGPARRVPHAPLQLGAPDRWWVLGVQRGALLLYGLTTAVRFMEKLSPEQVTLPPVTRSLAAVEEDLRILDMLMDRAGGEFFAVRPADADLVTDLLAVLTAHVSPMVMSWYRGLAPDFFGWLEQTAGEAAAEEHAGQEHTS
jgi:hypothetical protein